MGRCQPHYQQIWLTSSLGHAAGAPGAEAAEQGAEVGECVAERAGLLAAVAAADLPCNFLDQLIHELGGPDAVAEMTGRWG